MSYIYIGEIVNTHGIKGELRILSEFKYKGLVFKQGFRIYAGKRKEELIINTYRPHKNYDMVTFLGVDDINDAIAYKGDSVYINRDDIEVDDYFNEDIVHCKVYHNNRQIGIVDGITTSNAHDILVIKGQYKNHLVPFIDEFIEKIDIKEKRIDIKVIEGLISED